MNKKIIQTKRFTVHVQGHAYSEEATYRIVANSEKEAKKKAEEKFNVYTGYSFEEVKATIKTRGKK
jgi:hypothetical protein